MRICLPCCLCLLGLLAACGRRSAAPAAGVVAPEPPAVGASDADPEGDSRTATRLPPSDGHATLVHVPTPGSKPGPAQETAAAPAGGLEPDPAWLAFNEELLAEQRRSVVAAGAGGHPERLSSMAAPTPFDRESWKRDPKATAQAWAAVAEPARVRVQGSGVLGDPDIELLAIGSLRPRPGTSTRVLLRAAPFAPVSMFTADRVTVANGLCYGTVVADGRGLAVIDLQVPEGTTNHTQLIFASPVANGVVELVLDIPIQHADRQDTP